MDPKRRAIGCIPQVNRTSQKYKVRVARCATNRLPAGKSVAGKSSVLPPAD